jgi:hypothetical protein
MNPARKKYGELSTRNKTAQLLRPFHAAIKVVLKMRG